MVNALHTEPSLQIFNRQKIRHNRNRCASNFPEFSFLFDWSTKQLLDRLGDVKRDFPLTLKIGARDDITPYQKHPKIQNIFECDIAEKLLSSSLTFQAEEDFLPIKTESLDLIISNLSLHSVNDLPGALIQIKQALKPDGLFVASMLGGETLYQLRQIMSQVEIAQKDGLSPRVAPFADKQDMGGLLQRAGFALPVVDSDIITVTYDNAFKLMQDLRGMGENNAIAEAQKTNPGKAFFMDVAQAYQEQFAEADDRIVASFEIIFLLGWGPHESQQKPLKPGSAQNSLADVLNTQEIKTGDKTGY